MHLFLIGWNVEAGLEDGIANQFLDIRQIYPQLDPGTFFEFSADEYFLLSLTTSQKANGIRKYIWKDDHQIVLYSGCIIDQNGGFAAHDAGQLATHWDKITSSAEGQFAIIRLNDQTKNLELVTDFLGLEKVYACQDGKGWFISNNIHILRQITGMNQQDELGISTYLTIGWAGASRTFIKGIHSFRGGQTWRWDLQESQPFVSTYFSISDSIKQRKTTRANTDELQTALVQTCNQLAQAYGRLKCPLTGGRDSRLLAALLKTAGITAEYYTAGEEKSSDVQIAKQIARKLDLDYEHHSVSTTDILNEWEKASSKLVLQNDGMVSLWQVQDIIGQADDLENIGVELPGIGGEIARGYLSEPEFYILGQRKEAMQRFLFNRMKIPNRGLIAKQAYERTWQYFDRFCAETMEMGFKAVEIPDLFYLLDRVPNWIGSNFRKTKPATDLFSPLATHEFVKQAYLYSALERYVEPLHYQLINNLAPELGEIPFAQGPWRNQNPLTNLGRWVLRLPLHEGRIFFDKITGKVRSYGGIKAFDQLSLFESLTPIFREICLDHSASYFMWDFVDRNSLEKMLSTDAAVADRAASIESLFLIFTLFLYFSHQ
jgi:asparagine synthase (glutamine-hydrolysing)